MSATVDIPPLVAVFAERAASVGTPVQRAARAESPIFIAGLLAADRARTAAWDAAAQTGLPELAPALATAGIKLLPSPTAVEALAAVDAGISFAAFAVAETGSVALAAAAPADRLVSMLPPLHVVVLKESTLLPDLDATVERVRAWTIGAVAQPYVSLVTGASRTSDIERVLTIGVHGPRVQHVVLLSDE